MGKEAKASKQEREGMVALYLEGRSVDQVARMVGRDRVTVYKYLKEAGVELRSYTPPAKTRRKKKEKRERECLKCDREFMSDGIYNRICPNCREANALIAQTEQFPDLVSRGQL